MTGTAICATDVKIVRNGHRKLPAGSTIILGHELVGVVESVGTGNSSLKPGQRVGVIPNAGCGVCAACRRGQANYCAHYTAFGIDRNGGHAPYVLIPERFVIQGNLLPLPPGVSDDHGCLLEPMSCVINCIRHAKLELGDTVVIYGGGPMGLLAVALCRLGGAARIVVLEPHPERRELSRQIGADVVLEPGSADLARLVDPKHGRGANVVIVACTSTEAQTQGLSLLEPFGRLCLFASLPMETPRPTLDSNAVHYGNLVVTGTTGGSAEDYLRALAILEADRIDVKRIIAERYSLKHLQQAFDHATANPLGKIVLVADGRD